MELAGPALFLEVNFPFIFPKDLLWEVGKKIKKNNELMSYVVTTDLKTLDFELKKTATY